MSLSFLEQFDKYKSSQNIALVCGSISLTYAELYNRCCVLAFRLRALGVGIHSTASEHYDIFNPGETEQSPWVVIISHRSVNAVIGVIATFMAGGAYVLIESDAPDRYVRGIIEDTASAIVLRSGDFYEAEESVNFTYTFPKENEIACAIFTSGSTGTPKGAVLEHRIINEIIRWQTAYMKPAEKAVSSAGLSPMQSDWTATATYAPFRFIASMWEIFFPLANGLTLHILDENTRCDLFALENYIENNRISYMFLPPNVAEVFTQTYKGNALKYLRVAGGRLKSCGDPGGRYEIMYHLGMSENGGSVTFKSISSPMSGDISIGRAWDKTKVYVDSETGEIAVSGPSLFRGYLSRRKETFDKLVKNPYSNEPGYEMMYLSGDLARTDENGEFVHMGRDDWNIKIRDMKVNPMQVEIALGECTGVAECCVTTQLLGGEKVLIGWVTGGAEEETLRAELSALLPEYMIPSVLIVTEKLPRNINGKIDRSLLTYAQTENEPLPHADMVGQRGMNEAETKIAGMFERLLGLPSRFIGAEDSFLQLGGDSLKFIRLQAEIAREFSQNIPYTVLFASPTPRRLAAVLQNRTTLEIKHIPSAKPMNAYPLSAPMRQMWLLWRTGQDRGKYTVSIKCRFTGELNRDRLQSSLEELVRRNAILRSRFEERGSEVFQIVEDSVDVSVCDYPRREFNLTAVPIFDISLDENVLMFTTHHIIADAVGQRILMEDFWTLYGGEEPQEAVQAHDVTMWSLDNDAAADENYWLQMFSDGVPELTLPYDFSRPAKLTLSAKEAVLFNDGESARLREYAISHNVTLFQLFLAAYALLLSELSGCGDSVTIGIPFSGREHPDTARVIGNFVRTLPVKLDVFGLNLNDALSHTRERFAAAWEHQGISLERMTELIDYPRTISRNPFYDVMINYVPQPRPLPDSSGLHHEILRGEYHGAIFDLVLDLREETNGVAAVFTYAKELFNPKTILRWMEALKKLLLTHELELNRTHGLTIIPEKEKDAVEFDKTLPQVRELLQIWNDVLGTKDVLPGDDFFEAGGTSLAAIRMEAALFEKGWLLSAPDIFQNPRLYMMAALMVPLEEIDWEEA